MKYIEMVEKKKEVVEEIGVDEEIIDMRQIESEGVDWEKIEEQVRKKGNVMIVEKGD